MNTVLFVNATSFSKKFFLVSNTFFTCIMFIMFNNSTTCNILTLEIDPRDRSRPSINYWIRVYKRLQIPPGTSLSRKYETAMYLY